MDFPAGINTKTYEYYIDFASKYKVPYIILDDGWYKLGNLLDVSPDIKMDELSAYAKQKNVGLILWTSWKTLDDQLAPALDQFEKWGVKGIKVDFMQRSDQVMMNYYHKICREAAKRHMLVDFHGDQKPATMTRTWPNLINTEGVRGMECYGLHAGRHAKCHAPDLCSHQSSAYGAGDALPSARHVRRL